ncbi:hypothetical protein BA190_24140 [Labrys sp. WJW]|uniref:hypothetical protein n=1 Tax=Labrys sp. WJW TaxID=1737983 RepID=UPI0008308872|nr:hypothetical protein [Labrys sp. WJW]OCC02415.1 hypothetical protein BA190_24140 [Labrys sp. WJW]
MPADDEAWDTAVTIEQQGWGPITAGYGASLRKTLQHRDGQATLVCMADGREVLVYDIAWCRDAGDWWEHVTCNTSRESVHQQREVHVFHLSDVVCLRDAETGELLQSQTPDPGAR